MDNEQQYNEKNKTNSTLKDNLKVNENVNGQLNTHMDSYEEQSNMENEKNYLKEKIEKQIDEKERKNKAERPLKIAGIVCIVFSVIFFCFSGASSAVDHSQAAADALKNKVSTSISTGVILLAEDGDADAQDYTITHKSEAKDTKIWVWDYAAEDGDYVQVIVNGTPIGDAFMIKHKPQEFTVPATAKVEIKGVKDGGGGITYAVKYDINGTTYFNGAPIGGTNTYTLVKE